MFTYILGTVYKREGGGLHVYLYTWHCLQEGRRGFTCLLIYLALLTRGKEGVYMFTYILGTVYKREGGGLHVYLYTWHCLLEGRRGFTCLLIYLTLFTRGKEGVYMFTYILDTVYKREGGGFTCLLIYLTLFTRGKEGVYMFTYILDTVYKREGGVYMFTYILDTVYKREGGGLHVYLYT